MILRVPKPEDLGAKAADGSNGTIALALIGKTPLGSLRGPAQPVQMVNKGITLPPPTTDGAHQKTPIGCARKNIWQTSLFP